MDFFFSKSLSEIVPNLVIKVKTYRAKEKEEKRERREAPFGQILYGFEPYLRPGYQGPPPERINSLL
jgi:hypothetical protein